MAVEQVPRKRLNGDRCKPRARGVLRDRNRYEALRAHKNTQTLHSRTAPLVGQLKKNWHTERRYNTRTPHRAASAATPQHPPSPLRRPPTSTLHIPQKLHITTSLTNPLLILIPSPPHPSPAAPPRTRLRLWPPGRRRRECGAANVNVMYNIGVAAVSESVSITFFFYHLGRVVVCHLGSLIGMPSTVSIH